MGVSSSTAGLYVCIIAAGISEAGLVITPCFSFVALANVALYERVIFVFVDIDPKTLK